jgi:preprotein translocase subunit SecB
MSDKRSAQGESPESDAALGVIQAADVRLNNLFLHHANVRLIGRDTSQAARSDVNLEFNLGMVWLKKDVILAVDLFVEVEQPKVFQAKISYRAEFESQPGVVIQNPREFWKAVVARIAPSVMYPFVRETYASLALKASVRNTLLPVINIQKTFVESDFDIEKIPTVPDDASKASDQVG